MVIRSREGLLLMILPSKARTIFVSILSYINSNFALYGAECDKLANTRLSDNSSANA